ncbi:MAG: hypothetical protein KR126chlam3_01179 [Chlamydiae bacterium]|nr:hypothetical protein [Chlamydiota bacterium]
MPVGIDQINIVKRKYDAIRHFLNERGRRMWAAAEAVSFGHGGIHLVCTATGLSTATVCKGIKEFNGTIFATDRVRRKGGGRKKSSVEQKGLLQAIEDLMEPTAKGSPESSLRWTSKSVRNISSALGKQGYTSSYRTVARLLHELGYSLQANKKDLERSSHEDRNAQFLYINDSVLAMQNLGQPVISVDTKKKEMVGNYKNNGQELSQKGSPVQVKCHDFPDPRVGKVVPYGVYDIGKNKGWVSVGISGDTAEFAVNTIRTWWYKMGAEMHLKATALLITADCGGSNGYRVRLWKLELQRLANELGIQMHVRHFPPGTSKWNKIEHRLFSYISKNWRGKPLITRETVVNLMANTRTTKGLEIRAVLDENEYETGKEVTDTLLAALNIRGDEFHPEWNYTISPDKQTF